MLYRKTQAFVIVFVILANLIIIFNPPSVISPVSAFEPPDIEGQTNYGGPWVVQKYAYRGNQTIVLDGTLIIVNYAKLVLRNVTLIMNSTSSDTYLVWVVGGCQLHILDNSTVKAYRTDPSYDYQNYIFWAEKNSTLYVENSIIENCGNGTKVSDRETTKRSGLFVEASDATFKNVKFNNSSIGLILDNNTFDSKTRLRNLEFNNCRYGIYFNASSGYLFDHRFTNCSTAVVFKKQNSYVESVTVTKSSIAGIVSNGDNTIVTRSVFRYTGTGMYLNGSKNSVNQCEFYDLKYGIYANDNTSVINSVFKNTGTDVYFNGSDSIVDSCEFYDSGYGIYAVADNYRILYSDFLNMSYAAYVKGSNTTVDECSIIDVTETALYIEGRDARVYETTIDYTRNGIVFKGSGGMNESVEINFTRVWHNNGTGLFLDSSNVSVTTDSVHNSTVGLFAPRANSRVIVNNSLFDLNKKEGIITWSDNASITNTTILSSAVGLDLRGQFSRALYNTINNCTTGINLISNHSIIGNTVIKGTNFSFSAFKLTTNVTISSCSIVNSWNSTLVLDHTDGFIIKDNKFIDNSFGLYLNGTDNTQIINNILSGNGYGMTLRDTTETKIGFNTISNNADGFWIDKGNNILIFNNTLNTIENGTYVNGSDSVEVHNNTFTACDRGIILNGTNNLGFYDNIVEYNLNGLRLNATNTTMVGNTFNNSAFDLNLTGNNRTTTAIYHNNFYNAIISAENSLLWSLGYPDGGNYYDYSNLTDHNCTEWQNISGPDGLMDDPYVLNATYNVTDPYPLAVPWPINHLPHADDFTFAVNISVKPMAVMFIANGSDVDNLETELFPYFEYRAPNGTWENDSISLYRYLNDTWYANLTHPLNGSAGWYDIRVRFRDPTGYFSNMITIYHAFNITTEKPKALSFNANAYAVNRTHTIGLQLNGTDPDESEFNLTPQAEVRHVSNNTWRSSNFYDPQYIFVNFTGNDTGNYTGGYWKMKFTPETDLPAGQYFIRIRFNDTDYDFSDWFYHTKTVQVNNNYPRSGQTSVNNTAVLRTRTLIMTADATDIEDTLANMTCIMQYRSPSGQWTDFNNEEYNDTLQQWTAVFTPNITFELGSYDFRVEFLDRDNDTTGWNENHDAVTVENNQPFFDNITFSRPSLRRTEFVLIYINGSDVEDIESLLAPQLQYQAPLAQPGDWVSIPMTAYINGRWVANLTIPASAELGLYDFRVKIFDADAEPSTLDWEYFIEALEVLNNRPVITNMSLTPTEVFRGDLTTITLDGKDIEDLKPDLTINVEYRGLELVWKTIGEAVYQAGTGRWEIEFIPPVSGSTGLFDIRAMIIDADNGNSGWSVFTDVLFVKNNPPLIEDLSFSKTEIFRQESLTIYVNGSDTEDSPDKFILVELQMLTPGATEWEILPNPTFKNGLHETTIAFDLFSPLAKYSFRARVFDSNGDETGWFEQLDAVELINRPPQLVDAEVTPIIGDISTMFNFSVTYVELEGELPASIHLNIVDKKYIPEKVDESDNNPVDGIDYHFNISLPIGEYSFFFSATDENGGYAQSIQWSGLIVENVSKPVELGIMEVSVVDKISGMGIPRASVFYSPTHSNFIKLIANASGGYRITNLQAGKYMIYASAVGYQLGSVQEVLVGLGRTTSVIIQLSRENSPDAVNYKIAIKATKSELALGEDIIVEALVTDQKGDPVGEGKVFIYNWDFDDGSNIVQGKIKRYNYTTPGYYNITLTVFDDQGLIDSKSITILVNSSHYVPPDIEPPDDNNRTDGDTEDVDRLGVYLAVLGTILAVNIILVIIIFLMIHQRRKLLVEGRGTGNRLPGITEEAREPEIIEVTEEEAIDVGEHITEVEEDDDLKITIEQRREK